MCQLTFFMYAFPLSNVLWEYQAVEYTWTHRANGSYVYFETAREWTAEEAGNVNHSCITDVSYDVYPNITSEYMIAAGTLYARTRSASCGGGGVTQYIVPPEESLATDDVFERYMNLHIRFGIEDTAGSRSDVRAKWETSPVQCECKAIDIVKDDPFGTYYVPSFFIGTTEMNTKAINGWHDRIDFTGSFDTNVRIATEETEHTVSCCSCYGTTLDVSTPAPYDCSKFDDDMQKSRWVPTPHNIIALLGWDILGAQAAILAALLCPYVVSFNYYFKNFPKTLAISMALVSFFVTLFGDGIGRGVIGIPSLMNASAKALVCVVTITFVGTQISKTMIDSARTNVKHSVSRVWYIWSIAGTNITAILFGPLLFNIFLSSVYTDPETSEMMRIAIASFGVPVLFWLLSTAGRFAAYSVAKYGNEEGHLIERKHSAHKVYFVLQFIYSAYSRALVVGMAGPTSVVGPSISKRWPLIISAFLSSVVSIITRMTTQTRDRYMYLICCCGRKKMKKDFFDDPPVSKFLNRDMILLETFVDITTLTGLTVFTLIVELFIGVDPADAVISAIINWLIQALFEQLNNFAIFLLRERSGVFSDKFGSFAAEKEAITGVADCGAGGSYENIKKTLIAVSKGTYDLLFESAWFMMLAMPYVTFLLGKVVGGSLIRGLSIHFGVDAYPHVYETAG